MRRIVWKCCRSPLARQLQACAGGWPLRARRLILRLRQCCEESVNNQDNFRCASKHEKYADTKPKCGESFESCDEIKTSPQSRNTACNQHGRKYGVPRDANWFGQGGNQQHNQSPSPMTKPGGASMTSTHCSRKFTPAATRATVRKAKIGVS